MHQLALWEAAFSFSEVFWRLSARAHFMLGDLKCTCPHWSECSGVLTKNCMIPVPTSLFTGPCPEQLYFGSPDEKRVLKGKHFAHVEEVKQKNGRSTKRHQNWQVQKLFWAVEKPFPQVYCIRWRVLWRDPKFKHVKINTQFFISKFQVFGFCFCFFWSPLIYKYLHTVTCFGTRENI